MDELKKKYEENKKLAISLKEQNHYNASVNRYYYSIYQKILVYIGNYLNQNKGKNSHIDTIRDFMQKYNSENKLSDEEYNKLKDNIKSVKRLRVLADYENKNICELDIKQVEIMYNYIDSKINI